MIKSQAGCVGFRSENYHKVYLFSQYIVYFNEFLVESRPKIGISCVCVCVCVWGGVSTLAKFIILMSETSVLLGTF